MGGLASVLVAALLRPLLAAAWRSGDAGASPASLTPTWTEVLEASTHVFAGAGIGMLFWLSWGFAALVAVPWWVRGLTFGLVCSAAIVLPMLVATAFRLRMQRRVLGVLLLEWSYTCTMAGLACAWVAEAAQ